MKRDLELLRKILLAVEDAAPSWAPKLSVEGYSPAQIGYHSYLLIDAGLARGADVTTHSSTGPEALVRGLTWAGHEFAELARDDARWKRAIAEAEESTSVATLDILRQLMANPSRGLRAEAAQKGFRFEREVAAIYRTLGASVEQDVVLAGNQIDILLEESTSSGSKLRIAIECKSYSRPAGIEVVNQFASLIALLKQRGIVDRGVIVASQGFTKQARAAASEMGVDLIEFADLQQRVQGKMGELQAAEGEIIDEARRKAEEPQAQQPPRIFVLMPFASEFNDVYLLGIRDVAERLGFVVERADDIEHSGSILEVIQDQIRQCDIIVADMSGRNPNVFYEIGYAQALGRPTVLLCRGGETVPFDLQSINYIGYTSIVDLRDRLEKRLKSLSEQRNDPA